MAQPRVKICGITNLRDAERSVELGAWALGLIFYPHSPRRCARDDAVAIATAFRRRVELCGVFVNAPLDEVVRIADQVGLTMLQLHGDEGPAYCAEAARRTGCRVMKAARVETQADVRALEPFHTDYHLLDSAARGLHGGSGQTFDWALVAQHPGTAPVVLSGGLTPDNVAAAVAAAAPFAVDSASGVEAEPGRKDPAKLERFFAAVAESATAAPAQAAP